MVQSRQAEEKIRAFLTFPCVWLIKEEKGDETMDTRDGGEEQLERLGRMSRAEELFPAPHSDLVPLSATQLRTV